MKYFNILVFSTIISTVSYGQIAFSTESWEDIKQRSQLEKKAIFIDVYTKWCGPCKKLDKTTFQDPDVSAYMNAHFINVKWDAESAEYRNLAKSHSVSAYPTLMFLDNDEIEIKRVVGFQNNSRLLDLAKNVLTFFNTDFLALSNALLEAPTKETIEAFLTRYEGLNFASKSKVFNAYLPFVEAQDPLEKKTYDIIIDNMSTVDHIEMAVKHLPTIKPMGADNMRDKVRYQSRIKAEIQLGIKECFKLKKTEDFEKLLELNYVFAKKINALSKGSFALEENTNSKLDYYSKFKMKEAYINLVNQIIQEKINPFPPSEVIANDNNAKNLMQQAKGEGQAIKPATARSILKRNSLAYKKATLLNTIAQNYFSFFNDLSQLEKALGYAELSTEYLDIPETRLTRARLLNKLEKTEMAVAQLDLGLQSSLLDWRIKSDLLGLRKKLIKN